MPTFSIQDVLFRLGLVCITWLPAQTTAYAFHSSCRGTDLSNVKAASEEAIKVLKYTQDRVRWGFAHQMPQDNQGTLVPDMLGDNSPRAWTDAKTWFNIAVNNLGPYSTSENDRVLIYCSDAHLTLINANTGSFRVTGTESTVELGPLRPGHPASACSDIYEAFGYPMGFEWGSTGIQRIAIVLCPPTLTAQTLGVAGLQRTDHNYIDIDISWIEMEMTYKILHEFVHIASLNQFPRRLPSGRSEVYNYREIAKKGPNGNYDLTAQDKGHNADSFALLAIGWYANLYYVENGKFKMLRKKNQIPNPVPDNVGAVDAPSPDSSSGDSSSGDPVAGGAPPRPRVRRFDA